MTKELADKKTEAIKAIRGMMDAQDSPSVGLEMIRDLIVCCEGMEELLEEMKAKQEPKYKIRGQIINRESGLPIPDDEPIFILRARDVAAVRTLESYRSEAEAAGSPPDHLQAVQLRVEQFRKFSSEHPDRMKKPDTVLTEEWANL